PDDRTRRKWARPKEMTMVLDRQVARGELTYEEALLLAASIRDSAVYNPEEADWLADWIEACERAKVDYAKSLQNRSD
ncbi:MAG: hypothetical protein LC667_01350, partial [Thioalkalivibrio sp.]|nr:hypothetical protein [Thioalkalivibrio sp.]